MITPTVGRVVWLYEWDEATQQHYGPLAAHVCHVWDDTRVNLMAIDRNGQPHPRTSICLVQPDEPVPHAAYCCWMPYQVAKAHGGDNNSESAEPRPEPATA